MSVGKTIREERENDMFKAIRHFAIVITITILLLTLTESARAGTSSLSISDLVKYDDIWIFYGSFPGNPMHVTFKFEQYDDNQLLINSRFVDIYDAAHVGNVWNIARNTPSFFHEDYDDIISEIDDRNILLRAEYEDNDGNSTLFEGYLQHICGEPVKNDPCPEGHIIVIPPSGETFLP